MPTNTIKRITKTKTMKVAARYTEAVGRRKTSVARVRITPNPKQELVINGQPFDRYFQISDLQRIVLVPLTLALAAGKWKISVHVRGGGIHSQAEAIAMGLARVLIKVTPELRPVFKQKKLLRRDSRMKERRKFGLKKARKAPQWSKL